MYNTNDWCTYIGVLDKNICKDIITLANNKWIESEYDSSKGITDSEVRVSEIAWISKKWVYEKIWPFMAGPNDEAGWKYNIKGAENMQVTRYGAGGFYDWHRDGRGDHLSIYNRPQNRNLHGLVRKLSMTVLLNEDYEGGEFQFASYQQEECTISTPKFNKVGSIIIFPSIMEHRVVPVTKGTRYSLVVWFLGPPFV